MRTPFTREDKLIIVRCISESPTNLQKAFKKASGLVNHSEQSICFTWYKKIKTDPEFATIFVTGSKNGFAKNTKNTPEHATPARIGGGSGFELLTYDSVIRYEEFTNVKIKFNNLILTAPSARIAQTD